MTVFQGMDGELRVSDYGINGTTYHLEVLFCEMDFTVPLGKPRTEETLIMDRGRFDSNAHYIEGPDTPRYAPVNLTFSCRLADTVNTVVLSEWMSGVTKISGSTQLYTYKGKTAIDGNTLPNFADTYLKYAYKVEVLWDGTNDYGVQCNEVYFPPDQQELREAQDSVMLSCNGMVYGDVTRITAFDTNTTSIL